MERVVTSSGMAPPLPPKTRRGFFKSSASLIDTSPPASTTVISSPSQDRFNFSIQEAHNTTLVSTIQRQHQQSPSASPSVEKHVVKIRISPGEDVSFDNSFQGKVQVVHQQPHSLPHYPTNNSTNNSCIRININNNEENMIRTENYMKLSQDRPNPYFFCGPFPSSTNGLISSGQSSPSDTLDSGTCSDLDGSTPPPLPKKSPSTVTVIVNGDTSHHKRNCSLASSGIDVDSDDEGSNISCDSLNGHESSVARLRELENIDTGSADDESPPSEAAHEDAVEPVVVVAPSPVNTRVVLDDAPSGLLPRGLLQDIRERSSKLTITPSSVPLIAKTWIKETSSEHIIHLKPVETRAESPSEPACASPASRRGGATTPLRGVSPALCREDTPSPKLGLVREQTYEDRIKEAADKERESTTDLQNNNGKYNNYTYESDRFYTFHLNENVFAPEVERVPTEDDDGQEDLFAGVKNYSENKSTTATIRSAKGTVRGVKNRVRAGIATFLQINTDKGFKDKELGKVVLYTTTMGVVRSTFHECLKVKQILRTLMVKFEERDVFMSREVQTEIRERMEADHVVLPQLFVEGQHIGDAETVERLNETGELRKMLKPFKSADACHTCAVCGGYNLLPCPMCNGSKKSVHRNDFTAGFVALKCMNCDEVGLVRCHAC